MCFLNCDCFSINILWPSPPPAHFLAILMFLILFFSVFTICNIYLWIQRNIIHILISLKTVRELKAHLSKERAWRETLAVRCLYRCASRSCRASVSPACCSWKRMGVGISWTWGHIFKVSLISHMICDTSLNLSEPQFPHREMNTHCTELCGEDVRRVLQRASSGLEK